MQLNLHELINQPGYGKANEAVRKAGCWNEERAVIDGKMQRITVEVRGYVVETEHFIVTASSAEEAKQKAYDLADFDEIVGATITKVEEPQS